MYLSTLVAEAAAYFNKMTIVLTVPFRPMGCMLSGSKPKKKCPPYVVFSSWSAQLRSVAANIEHHDRGMTFQSCTLFLMFFVACACFLAIMFDTIGRMRLTTKA